MFEKQENVQYWANVNRPLSGPPPAWGIIWLLFYRTVSKSWRLNQDETMAHIFPTGYNLTSTQNHLIFMTFHLHPPTYTLSLSFSLCVCLSLIFLGVLHTWESATLTGLYPFCLLVISYIQKTQHNKQFVSTNHHLPPSVLFCQKLLFFSSTDWLFFLCLCSFVLRTCFLFCFFGILLYLLQQLERTGEHLLFLCFLYFGCLLSIFPFI